MPANRHMCPMCWRVQIPIWRALCSSCHSMVPWGFRMAFVTAYRRRVVDPVGWQEKCIQVRQWYLGRNIPDPEEGESDARE
jgi:hypothetical protein